MFRFLKKNSSRGAALVEYAILIGVVAVVVILAVVELGRTTSSVYEASTVALVDAEITNNENPSGTGGTGGGEPGGGSTTTGWPGGEEPSRPIQVTEWGCLADSAGAEFWCGEGPFEVPGDVDFRINDEDGALDGPFDGALCAYDVQSSSFFSRPGGWGNTYACVPPESEPEPQPMQYCTLDRNDYERYDEAWDDRTKAEVTQDNDMYCEVDPTSRGAYRAVPGATETYVLL